MRVDALATASQYRDHILPVWDALPAEVRGNLFTHGAPDRPTGNITIVSASGDLRRLRGSPSVYIEHGIGFSFVDRHGRRWHPSYTGHHDRPGVILFLNGNEQIHSLTRQSHPNVRGVLIGSPKMDSWVNVHEKNNDRPVVAYSTHWDCKVVPETRSAHPEFRWALRPGARNENWDWWGHAHPRAWGLVKNDYKRFGIPAVRSFYDVLAGSDVYVADATSTLYEFAYTGRPVVVVNASFYRRDVNHGLRFWDYVPGLQVDRWQDMNSVIAAALDGEGEDLRARAVDFAYPLRDGKAAQRAADAICELL